MKEPKDLTPTVFGYIVAYLLPGLAALVAVAFFLDPVANLLRSFATAQSSVGLFLFVLLLSLLMGMQLTAFRWLVFERLVYKSFALTAQELSVLRSAELAASFRLLIDEAYRYHQFFGAQVFVIPALFVGLMYRSNISWYSGSALGIGSLFLILEVVMWTTAAEGWRRYISRSHAFLNGGNHGNRIQEERHISQESKEKISEEVGEESS
jgi:hypothetical protein